MIYNKLENSTDTNEDDSNPGSLQPQETFKGDEIGEREEK